MGEQYHRGKRGELIVRLDGEAVEHLVRDELHRSALSIGALVIAEMIDDEVRSLCGERRKRSTKRKGYRYGKQGGYVVLGGQKVRIERPRVRSVDGKREVELTTYARLQQLDAIDEAVMRRLVRGVSCRNYRGVVETICQTVGVSRSSVSRSFVRLSEQKVRDFFARRYEGIRLVAIFIDGIQFKGRTLLVAIGVTDDGSKRVLSVRHGASENARVCTDLLEELRERGVSTEQPTLFVLDGAKALRTAVVRVWGEHAIVQRCRLHKIRNLRAYVDDRLWPDILAEVRAAYAEKDFTRAKRRLETTARWLGRVAPAAARSLREGLEETLTVTSLRLPAKLARCLMTTNLIESPFDRVRSMTRRISRWTEQMRMRWCVAGLLEAEQRFIRISGASEISKLLTAIEHTLIPSEKIA